MFTGIVEEVGTVASVRRGAHSAVLTINASTVLSDVHLGDSIATNGVCLTVTAFDGHSFSADVMHETLNRSSLGVLHAGSRVNLERAMAANGRFGGHMVSGHIDGTGFIRRLRADDNAIWYTIEPPRGLMKYIVEKGSITIDGISLTVAEVAPAGFSVSVIPHTRLVTSLSDKGVGDIVNLECDLIGKYVERLLSFGVDSQGTDVVSAGRQANPGITKDFLLKNGF